MNKLVVLVENYNYGYNIELLDLISILSIICGILIITVNNPIVSVLFLIGLFLNISIYLMLIGNSFIGFSYLLVYIGAVSILFLFILMLINIRISDLLVNNRNSLGLAFFVGLFFFLTIYNIIYLNNVYILSNNNNLKLDYVTSNSWDNYITDMTDIATIGNILYTNYFIWLIITSVILLLAMVGCIAITISPKNNN
jgi:NADH-ubiquinone oxidoreductase chain 6